MRMGPCDVAGLEGKVGWLYAFDTRTGKKVWSSWNLLFDVW
jgi:hypothetical protein